MIKNFTIVLSLALISLAGCSEKNRAVDSCMDKLMASDRAEQTSKDQLVAKTNCSKVEDLEELYFDLKYPSSPNRRIVMDSCSVDTSEYPFGYFFGSARFPTIHYKDSNFDCNRTCGGRYREEACTADALAECWTAKKAICERQKFDLIENYTQHCQNLQDEVKKRGLGGLSEGKEHYRNVCTEKWERNELGDR